MPVSVDMPEDVIILHDALQALCEHKQGDPLTLYLKNCGTALRFLEIHLAQCYAGEPITLTGDARLMERRGKPTTQTTSALILHGIDVPVTPDESPYIIMSRKIAELYNHYKIVNQSSIVNRSIVNELDWSSAAFWYEYIAIHGGELLLEGLTDSSLQGDRIVADIYAKYFGITTTFTPVGAKISNLQSSISNHQSSISNLQSSISLDFERTPDLYPAIALTCERLGITLHATGTERLAYKECNRLEAVACHETRHDHRMAMALLAADLPVDDTACIAKSYPAFLTQLRQLTS